MHKKMTILSLLLALLSFPLFAQEEGELAPPPAEEELPDASIDVSLNVVSNYVFRGDDLFANRARQKGESFGSHTGELAFQPSINFNTPVEGLFFNIWGSFAMGGRNDQDVDQVFQTAPAGSDLLTGVEGAPNQIAALAAAAATPLNTALTQNNETGGLPGLYKELNGLKRLDEIDLTIGYARDTKVGTMGFGFIAYTFPTIVNGVTKAAGAEEIYVSYALPFLPEVTLSMNTDIDTSVSYYKLAYGSGIELADGISLDYGAGVGYGSGYLTKRVEGIQDVSGSIGVSLYGFSVAYNIAYRPNLKFFDEDGGNLDSANWINGASNAGDGLVADPAATTGRLNTAINSAITNAVQTATGNTSYTYTPRQKLPSTLWWISVGYSFSI